MAGKSVFHQHHDPPAYLAHNHSIHHLYPAYSCGYSDHQPSFPQDERSEKRSEGGKATCRIQTGVLHQHIARIQDSSYTDSAFDGKTSHNLRADSGGDKCNKDDGSRREQAAQAHQPTSRIPQTSKRQAQTPTCTDRCSGIHTADMADLPGHRG